MLTKTVTFALLLIGFTASALAADAAKQEISTALQHAVFSAKSDQVKAVHLHLHHVVNCLVGKDGKQFDGAFGDPCQGMGSGAINDTMDASVKASLGQVLSEAERGLSENDVDSARASASKVRDMLQGLVGSGS